MQAYLFKRIMLMIPTLFIVAVVLFILTHLLPGDAVMIQLAGAGSFRPEDAERLRASLGIDRPYFVQMADWLIGLLRGDLGRSLWTQKPVVDELLARLPVTLELALLAFVLSSCLGVLFGVLSAIRRDSPIDHGVRILAVTGLSFPDFYIGTLIILLPLIYFGYAPPTRYVSPWDDLGTNLRMFLPAACAIGLRSSSSIMRLTRGTLLEVLRNDYVRTAWAKGLNERVIIVRHVLRNALIPVITVMGTQFSALLGGTVTMELLFSMPGMGRLLLDSINQRDLPQLQGNIMFIATVFLFVNLLVDMSYGYLDPRIRFQRR
ncbi:MAG: ABC transporter permease [Chloroflexi bacterium]|nr:ABC transporter permease [Chloroflexota bacterium]